MQESTITYEERWKLIRSTAERLQKKIEEVLQSLVTEADFRRPIDNLLEEFCQKVGINPLPRLEYTLATGRADTVFNRFIIEYERPGTLSDSLSHRPTAHAVQQVKDYIKGLATKQKQEINRIAGVAFDGHYIVFVRYRDGDFSVEGPTAVSQASLERFLRWLASLASGIALTADNLNRDFSIEQLRSQNILRALTNGLDAALQNSVPMVRNLFEQWRLFFSRGAIELRPYPFGELVSADGETLRRHLGDMESGGIFRAFGITNLLEGDFFSWYRYAWNDRIESAIRDLLTRLDEYDPATLTIVPEETRDLFKKLYHYLLPREIRHNLGEYYTPDWLAQRLLVQLDGDLFGRRQEDRKGRNCRGAINCWGAIVGAQLIAPLQKEEETDEV